MAELSPQLEQQEQSLMELDIERERTEVSAQLGAVSVDSMFTERYRPMTDEEKELRRQELSRDNVHISELDSLYPTYEVPRAEVVVNGSYHK